MLSKPGPNLHQNKVPAFIKKCSTIGPSDNTGKKVNAPTIRITPISSTTNSGVCTGNVPADGGTLFFVARFPAIAIIGIIIRNRPINIARPVVVLYQSVLLVSPLTAEPLLPVADT